MNSEDKMVHQASSLSRTERAAVESLLGRPLTEHESISVQAFSPPQLSDEERQAAIAKLRALFAEANQNLAAAADEDTEEVFEEAMRTSRPNFRQVR